MRSRRQDRIFCSVADSDFSYLTNKTFTLVTKECFMSLQKLIDEVENLKIEYEKFERGNKTAGTRARKSLQNVKKYAQEIRNLIQDAKKTEE